MDLILCINVNFKKVFLIFSNICCRYTLILPHSSYNIVFSINEFFHHKLLKQILNYVHCFNEMSMCKRTRYHVVFHALDDNNRMPILCF